MCGLRIRSVSLSGIQKSPDAGRRAALFPIYKIISVRHFADLISQGVRQGGFQPAIPLPPNLLRHSARDLEAAERGELEKTPEQIVAERIAEEAHLGEDIQKKYALPEADFPIAFDQWTVIYADGTTRDFDATCGVLAE